MVTAANEHVEVRADIRSRVAELGSVLGVWAHPDDETYLSGGLMRLALENGQPVTCLNATSGEHGTADPSTWPPDQLGRVRRAELVVSGRLLAAGLDARIDHRWLNHADGRCHDVPIDVAATQVARLIEEIRPDTVVTFDPTGVTGHLDHRAVARWVLQAAREHPQPRVLGAAVTESWVSHMDGLVDLGDYFYPGFPRPIAQTDIALELVCDDELWAIKNAAIRAHHTQVAGIADDVANDVWRAFNDVEAFIDLTPHHRIPTASPDTGRTTTSDEPTSEEPT